MWAEGKHFNPETNEPVLLLSPSTNSSSSIALNNNNHDPTQSKLGGKPIYYDTNASSKKPFIKNNPKCQICKKGMYLLSQVYTPLDKAHRTLYVFGCNDVKCCDLRKSLNVVEGCAFGGAAVLGSFVCLRDQTAIISGAGNDDDDDGNVHVGGNNHKLSVGNTELPFVDPWGSTGSDHKEKHNDDDDDSWGIDDDEDVDLEAMLAANELNEMNKLKIDNNVDTNDIPLTSCTINEPVGREVESKDVKYFKEEVLLDVYDEPIGVKNYRKSESDDAVDKMIENYLGEEEDEAIVKLLKKVNSGKKGNKAKKHLPSDDEHDFTGDELPKSAKHFIIFTNRLKRAPDQVIRYAFGGEPMWSSGKVNKSINVPPCSCGVERCFEMELIPNVLSLIPVDYYYFDNPPTATTTNSLNDKPNGLGCLDDYIAENNGGMNWGALAVFTCPNSCDSSFEEIVIVQESHDSGRIGTYSINKAEESSRD